MTISFWFWEHLKYCNRNRGAHFSIFYIMYTFYLPVMRVKINTKSRNDHSLHKLFMFHNLHRKSESWKKANVNLKENRCVKYTTEFSMIKLRMRRDRWEVHFANAKKMWFWVTKRPYGWLIFVFFVHLDRCGSYEFHKIWKDYVYMISAHMHSRWDQLMFIVLA